MTKERFKVNIRRIPQRHSRFLTLIRNRPLVLVGLFPIYILLSIVLGWIAFLVGPFLFYVLKIQGSYLERLIFALVFFGSLFIVWSHYIYLNFTTFISNVKIEGDAFTIIRIIQAVLTTVFAFAVIYYYFQLFGGNEAFGGMHPINFNHLLFPRLGWDIVDKLMVIPPYETVIDCLYYSVVTISTVGMGDIHPLTPTTKLLTSSEIISGFVLIVLSLGSVVGERVRNERDET